MVVSLLDSTKFLGLVVDKRDHVAGLAGLNEMLNLCIAIFYKLMQKATLMVKNYCI